MIEATPGHPVWVAYGDDLESRPVGEHQKLGQIPSEGTTPGRWVDSHDLLRGDVVLLQDGSLEPIAAIEIVQHAGPVYNFRVAELQCYAVGVCSVLVHNSCWGTARSNYYKDLAKQEIASPSGKFSTRNIDLVSKGRAPQIRVIMERNGKNVTRNVSMELHHYRLPQRLNSGRRHEAWNLVLVTPWAHQGMDQFRHVGWTLVMILKGTNSW